MFPKSLTVQFGGMNSQFPFSTENSVRQMIGTEVGLGFVKFYQYEQMFNNSSTICIEASWETLSRLHQAIGKVAQADNAVNATEMSLNTIGCSRNVGNEPVPR